MTDTSQPNLFDYATNEPDNESPEEQDSSPNENSTSTPNPKTETEDNVTEDSEQPCSCYYEEKENWHETLQKYNIPTVKCGHAIDYLCSNVDATLKQSSTRNYAFKIRCFVEYLHAEKTTVCDASLRNILQYFKHRAKRNFSESTLSSDLVSITNLYKHITLYQDTQPEVEWALIREEIDPSDFQTAETVERDPLTKNELNKLLDEMDCVRNQLMTRVAVELGPRNIDLCTMMTKDIDLDKQEAVLSNTKEGGTYSLPIADELALLLRRWIDTERSAWPYSEKHDYLFPSIQGRHITPKAYTDIVREAAEQAGIQGTLKKIPISDRQKETLNIEREYRILHTVTPHTLRHTFAELLDDAGLPLDERSKALDHSDTTVTENHYGSNESGHKDLMKDLFTGMDRSSE